jgi:hypothetical protein
MVRTGNNSQGARSGKNYSKLFILIIDRSGRCPQMSQMSADVLIINRINSRGAGSEERGARSGKNCSKLFIRR